MGRIYLPSIFKFCQAMFDYSNRLDGEIVTMMLRTVSISTYTCIANSD